MDVVIDKQYGSGMLSTGSYIEESNRRNISSTNEINYTVLRRHLRALIPEHNEYIRNRYPFLSKSAKDYVINSVHNPEILFNGISENITSVLQGFKGIFGASSQVNDLENLVGDISDKKGLGKIIDSARKYATALETLKDYDTIFEELYGDTGLIPPLMERDELGERSSIAMDSPLSKPKYEYKRKNLADFLEEKEIDRSDYVRMRRLIRNRFNEDFKKLTRLVKGWSFSDMDDDQKDEVYSAWTDWKDSGRSKKDFVRNHNISSMYTLNKIIGNIQNKK